MHWYQDECNYITFMCFMVTMVTKRVYTRLSFLFSFVLIYFPHFEKIKVGLCDLLAVSVYAPINFWMREPLFMKFGMYIMALVPISTAYFVNPSCQTVCLYFYYLFNCNWVLARWHVYFLNFATAPPIVARQRLRPTLLLDHSLVNTSQNTHTQIEEFLDASFSMQSM
jgi:hypothetical protein